MSKFWWKILSAILVLTSIVFGLKAPLAPGVPYVSPDRIQNGVTQVTITGYNTHFDESKDDLQVWLTNGDAIFCPYEMTVVDNTHIRVTFSITEKIENAFFDLYVNNSIDGTKRLPSAFLQSGLDVVENPELMDQCLTTLAAAPDQFNYPNQPILNETIRNIFYHVPSWFAMLFIMTVSLVFSIRYLRSSNMEFDIAAQSAAQVGLVFATIGLATGSIWARFTWGAWWVSDPRLNGAAVAFLIYLAYFVLRSSINDEEKAGRLAAVYNIFAFVMMMLFVMVIPRMQDSLHPGVGGNPAFSQYDLDDNMRMIFYPAVIGWIGMSLWLFQIKKRLGILNFNQLMRDAK